MSSNEPVEPAAAEAAAPAATPAAPALVPALLTPQAPAPQPLVLRALERIRNTLEPLTNRVFGPGVGEDEANRAGFRSFELQATEVMSRAQTQRAQKIVRAAVVVVLLMIVWAALARVDEITKGDARVISSRQLQLIQSFDGGVVSEILVKEGQVVEKDQLLLKIDETRATSGVRESADRKSTRLNSSHLRLSRMPSSA